MRVSGADAREELPQVAGAVLDRLRTRSPRVHCITNNVAQNFTANALLALGAVPSMTLSGEEIAAFVARADALLVNLGTMDAERREATGIAIKTAAHGNIPWVLDPVFVDRSPSRAAFARSLFAFGPKAVRFNLAEFGTLAGTAPAAPRAALADFARAHDVVAALSGETDLIADSTRLAAIANGHPLMAKVTAMGCVASALVAACLAVESDAWRASTAALLIVGVAGEIAAEKSEGPGSFAAAILDVLYALDGPSLAARAKVVA